MMSILLYFARHNITVQGKNRYRQSAYTKSFYSYIYYPPALMCLYCVLYYMFIHVCVSKNSNKYFFIYNTFGKTNDLLRGLQNKSSYCTIAEYMYVVRFSRPQHKVGSGHVHSLSSKTPLLNYYSHCVVCLNSTIKRKMPFFYRACRLSFIQQASVA